MRCDQRADDVRSRWWSGNAAADGHNSASSAVCIDYWQRGDGRVAMGAWERCCERRGRWRVGEVNTELVDSQHQRPTYEIGTAEPAKAPERLCQRAQATGERGWAGQETEEFGVVLIDQYVVDTPAEAGPVKS